MENKAAMKTDTMLKLEGMKLLLSELGDVDAERFVMLMNKERFDYTTWRKTNLDDESGARALSAKAMQFQHSINA